MEMGYRGLFVDGVLTVLNATLFNKNKAKVVRSSNCYQMMMMMMIWEDGLLKRRPH